MRDIKMKEGPWGMRYKLLQRTQGKETHIRVKNWDNCRIKKKGHVETRGA